MRHVRHWPVFDLEDWWAPLVAIVRCLDSFQWSKSEAANWDTIARNEGETSFKISIRLTNKRTAYDTNRLFDLAKTSLNCAEDEKHQNRMFDIHLHVRGVRVELKHPSGNKGEISLRDQQIGSFWESIVIFSLFLSAIKGAASSRSVFRFVPERRRSHVWLIEYSRWTQQDICPSACLQNDLEPIVKEFLFYCFQVVNIHFKC